MTIIEIQATRNERRIMQGWVKLHRKLLDSAVMTKSAYLHLWVTLLLMASHKETKFIFNDKEMTLQPGQLLTGIDRLKKITKIPRTTVHRILKFLENGTMISQHVTCKFRIISITNWQIYQAIEIDGIQSGTQMELKRNSDGTLAEAYKNVKNEKNVKNYRGNFQSEIEKQRQMIRDTLKKLEAEGEL